MRWPRWCRWSAWPTRFGSIIALGERHMGTPCGGVRHGLALGALHRPAICWWDLLDIALVSVLVYELLLLIRGTRAVQMALGGGFLIGLFFLSRWLELETVNWVIRNLAGYVVFAIIVLFQSDIRRALAHFGRAPFFRYFERVSSADETLEELVVATTTLSARRIGAIIVLERQIGLRNYIEGGIPLDATVTYDLLASIFQPGTPLHDGAVIVQGDRIAAAACFLPLSVNPRVSRELGTRHRAALGVTEESDAWRSSCPKRPGDLPGDWRSARTGTVGRRASRTPALAARWQTPAGAAAAPRRGARRPDGFHWPPPRGPQDRLDRAGRAVVAARLGRAGRRAGAADPARVHERAGAARARRRSAGCSGCARARLVGCTGPHWCRGTRGGPRPARKRVPVSACSTSRRPMSGRRSASTSFTCRRRPSRCTFEDSAAKTVPVKPVFEASQHRGS